MAQIEISQHEILFALSDANAKVYRARVRRTTNRESNTHYKFYKNEICYYDMYRRLHPKVRQQ